MGCMYRLTFPSGKAYIGITAFTAEQRLSEHVYNGRRGLGRGVNRAIRKYGAESAKLETLVIASDWEYLCELERKAIVAFGTKGPNGYNMTDGGKGACGYKHTPESLLKMGAVHKGKAHHTQPHSAESKARMSAAKKGKPKSDQHRMNIAKGLIGNKYCLGKKLSEEHKQAISKANTGKVWTDESRVRMSIAATKREEIKRAERSQRWTASNC